MIKKLRDKRIRLFKETFPEYEESKKGNIYHRYNPKIGERKIYYGGQSITKGTYHKVGTVECFDVNTEDAVFLIAPKTGKLMIKNQTKRYFKNVTLKDVMYYDVLARPFFIGRKFEYLKDHRRLWGYRIFQNFTSLKEAKKFLGFEFISDDDFLNLFQSDIDYIFMMGITPKKSNLVRLLSCGKCHLEIYRMFSDYIEMCKELDTPYNIPSSFKKLVRNHDDLSDLITQQKLANSSTEVCFRLERVEPSPGKTFFLDFWDEMGLNYVKLESQRDMFEEGLRQDHCIGSTHSNYMDKFSYYTIFFNDRRYDVQIEPNIGYVGHFYGAKNSHPPKELVKIVKNNNVSYKHRIVQIKEVETTSEQVFTDDLPF